MCLEQEVFLCVAARYWLPSFSHVLSLGTEQLGLFTAMDK